MDKEKMLKRAFKIMGEIWDINFREMKAVQMTAERLMKEFKLSEKDALKIAGEAYTKWYKIYDPD